MGLFAWGHGPGFGATGRERVQDFRGLRLLRNSTKNAAHFSGLKQCSQTAP
jgi:hypothetical protein